MKITRLKKTTTIATIFTLLLFFLFTPTPTHAQTTSLSIWPPLLQAVIKPGKTITQVYRLKNLGDDTTITAKISPFTPSDELGHIKLLDSKATPSFFSFQNADIDDFPTTFTLKAGKTQELVLKIRIPEDQIEADHYLTFLFESNTTGLIGGTGATSQATIGSNILLTISNDGQPLKSAKIEEFKVCNSKLLPICILDSFSPISFLLRVKNTGQTYFKATGQIEINNTFKRNVATLPIRKDNILSQTVRQLVTTKEWKTLFPLGFYSATATITPDELTKTISSTTRFLVFPYKAILFILLIFTFFRLTRRKKT